MFSDSSRENERLMLLKLGTLNRRMDITQNFPHPPISSFIGKIIDESGLL